LAISAWTVCTAAVSVFGIGKIDAARSALMKATQPAATPSASPSSSPSPAPDDSHVLTTPGGNVVARCDIGMVRVEWLSPAPGYRVQDADHGPGTESKVTFKTDGKEIRVVVRCRPDGPYTAITVG
jgi:hypothetical protein